MGDVGGVYIYIHNFIEKRYLCFLKWEIQLAVGMTVEKYLKVPFC